MKILILAISALVLTGCGGSSNKSAPPIEPSTHMAVVATDVYTDGSQVEFIDADGDLYKHLGSAFNDVTDIMISAYKEHFYRIHRGQNDTVKKVSAMNPDVEIWQYATIDENSQNSANPYELVFINENEAFLIRYESSVLWKVNLNAENQGEFKMDEVDLSAYIPEGRSFPHMSSGLILDGKLFITMQRLEGWAPSNTAYVAVIDIATLEEVDTGIDEDMKGIPLVCKNPSGIHYHEDSGILVSCLGEYNNDLVNLGGVDAIDPATYEVTSLIVEDSPSTKVSSIAIVDGDLAFYVSYENWGDANALYAFDPKTGVKIQDEPVAGLSSTSIAPIAVGPDGHLWAGDRNASNPGIHIIDVSDLSTVKTFINTLLPPADIAFVEFQGEPEWIEPEPVLVP